MNIIQFKKKCNSMNFNILLKRKWILTCHVFYYNKNTAQYHADAKPMYWTKAQGVLPGQRKDFCTSLYERYHLSNENTSS